jgi:ribonuclease Z
MKAPKLLGFSTAGVETSVEVPEFGLVLDIGRCSRSAVNHPVVLISHGHLDHVGAAVQHAARRAMMGMSEGLYVVPAAVAADVEQLFNAAGALDGGAIPRKVVALAVGDPLPLGRNRYVRPFQTFHRVPSQGYTIWERRHRLREDLRSLDPAELGRRRRAGEPIDEPLEVPLLSFTGDTRADVLEKTPELQRAETLVIEASFLDERVSVADARGMGHVHLDELIARPDLLPPHDIVLHHFSARYAPAEIPRLCARRLPAGLAPRVRILGETGGACALSPSDLETAAGVAPGFRARLGPPESPRSSGKGSLGARERDILVSPDSVAADEHEGGPE